MGKGRFVNQKLGKRMSRKFNLLKSELAHGPRREPSFSIQQPFPKKGNSREGKAPTP